VSQLALLPRCIDRTCVLHLLGLFLFRRAVVCAPIGPPVIHACAHNTHYFCSTTTAALHRYDSHRDSILRSSERYQAGGGGFEGGQRPADEEDLFQFFTSACYSGFGDGLRGFYGQWVCWWGGG
jgi:hypothetical protein